MKYLIGIQDFWELCEGGYVYVDKIEYFYWIIEGGKYFFFFWLCCFGKSLLFFIINELYRGSKELFQGFWIENYWDWEGEYWLVIWLWFVFFNYKDNEFKVAIWEGVEKVVESLGIELDNCEFIYLF